MITLIEGLFRLKEVDFNAMAAEGMKIPPGSKFYVDVWIDFTTSESRGLDDPKGDIGHTLPPRKAFNNKFAIFFKDLGFETVGGGGGVWGGDEQFHSKYPYFSDPMAAAKQLTNFVDKMLPLFEEFQNQYQDLDLDCTVTMHMVNEDNNWDDVIATSKQARQLVNGQVTIDDLWVDAVKDHRFEGGQG